MCAPTVDGTLNMNMYIYTSGGKKRDGLIVFLT
jgi:hypothetical protein